MKARKGLIKKFTGIDSVYEAPRAPDIHLNTLEHDVSTLVSRVLAYLDERELA